MNNPLERTTIDLRKLAEKRVPKTPSDVSLMSAEDIERLVYELEIHQEELEIQNEELRRAQLELHASLECYAELYDFAPVGYMTMDDNGTIVQANLTASTMLKRNRSSLVGSRFALLCDPASRIKLRDHIEKVLAGTQTQNCELNLVAAEGTNFDARLDSNRVAASDGSGNWQCRVIMTDITRRKHAENALVESEHHLKSLANAVPVLIGYVDADFRFKFANAAYETWFGLSQDTLIGQQIHHVFGPDSAEEISDYFADVLRGRQVEFETELTHLHKGRRQVQFMFVPDIGSNGGVKGTHILGTDITEQKVVEEQNSRRRIFAEQLVRLNASERDVYELLIRGKSNKMIAHELQVGLRTAERRRRIILEKLQIESLAELLQKLADIQGIRPE